MNHQLVASGADGAGGDLRLGVLIELEEKGYAAHGQLLGREVPSLISPLFPRLLAQHALHNENWVSTYEQIWKFSCEKSELPNPNPKLSKLFTFGMRCACAAPLRRLSSPSLMNVDAMCH